MAVTDTPQSPAALRNTTAALARHGARGRWWLEAMWRGDPLADAVVAEDATLVRTAIANGIDALEDPPPALVALFAELDSPPAWIDHDRCERAAAQLVRNHREYGLVLGAASLLAGAQNSIAGLPLVFTGRYATNAAVRSIEVGSWLKAVTTPGGMRRSGQGFEHTVRVRMIHAHVRAHLASRGDWREYDWGVPIPQPYMTFTLAEFCSVALRAMAQLGVRFTDAQTDDIVHLWRFVGWVVGVEPEFLPATLEDYAAVEELYASTSPGVDAADLEFVGALSDFQAEELARTVPVRWTRPMIHGLQRAFVGARLADELAIPDSAWKHLPRVIAPLNRTARVLHDRLIPDGTVRGTRRAYAIRERELDRLRSRYGVSHELVDDAP